ncbi:hypothetical protein BY458DRAFT_542742 [Sporodiniella umbellata]|nr:hypothetical protein BY458DRAFT_542742 [Sporodiniella umbellata]
MTLKQSLILTIKSEKTGYGIITTSGIIKVDLKPNHPSYLAYLPHSGLSNQRIELANGLLLAYMLNRTLIIPPAFLGDSFSWMPRESLLDHLSWLTTPKNFTQQCGNPTFGILSTYVRPSRCNEYRNLGIVSWSELHDLSALMSYVKFEFQNTVSLESFQKHFNVSDRDIYMFEDRQLYDWRLVLQPKDFLVRREKLLFLGSIFGSTRIKIIDPELKAIKKRISQVLTYRLDTSLGDTVHSIINFLGGRDKYMAIHFRTSDGPFKKELQTNLKKTIRSMNTILNANNSERYNNRKKNKQESYGKDMKIYIATDSDVPKEFFAPLDSLKDLMSPTKNLKNMMLPLVDAMIAAHAKKVLTTPRSTFSKYIKELHTVWLFE